MVIINICVLIILATVYIKMATYRRLLLLIAIYSYKRVRELYNDINEPGIVAYNPLISVSINASPHYS